MPTTFDKAASQVMGAVKDVKATFKGLTGVFKRLMEEHGKADAILRRLRMTSDENVRAELYPVVRDDLLSHETGEAAVVYRQLAEHPALANIVIRHAQDASEIRSAIAEVDAIAFGDAAWGPAFGRLVEIVEKHAEEEESEFFPKAQDAIGEEEAKALLARYEAAKHLPL